MPLERDLHDGAQHPVSLRIGWRWRAGTPPATLTPTRGSNEWGGELEESIEELRDLAHGIFPSVLADRGLLPALRAVGRRGLRPIEVTDPRHRTLPAEIESALYFCCLEAFQNATKHAGAEARIMARLSADEEQLRVEVSDDGSGFDVGAVSGGVGLRIMEDRLAAVRGRLVIYLARRRDADRRCRTDQRLRAVTSSYCRAIATWSSWSWSSWWSASRPP